ncbi:TP53 regulating kinase [Linnemannia zychae]|nr:TP53 regulating kinase [Linnemannia zychae]
MFIDVVHIRADSSLSRECHRLKHAFNLRDSMDNKPECKARIITAKVYVAPFCQRQVIIKERFTKAYRHPILDKKLTSRRVVQYIDGCSVREYLTTPAGHTHDAQFRVAHEIGHALGLMHNIDVIHGDLTTSNLLMRKVDSQGEQDGEEESKYDKIVLIDFGLSYVSQLIEDKAVDLYVLERAFISTHPNTEAMFEQILKAYGESCKASKQILKKLEDVRLRGRKRSMLG